MKYHRLNNILREQATADIEELQSLYKAFPEVNPATTLSDVLNIN